LNDNDAKKYLLTCAFVSRAPVDNSCSC
jgi:hypothetical protein